MLTRSGGQRRKNAYEPLLLENEREAVADLLQYLESELACAYSSCMPLAQRWKLEATRSGLLLTTLRPYNNQLLYRLSFGGPDNPFLL